MTRSARSRKKGLTVSKRGNITGSRSLRYKNRASQNITESVGIFNLLKNVRLFVTSAKVFRLFESKQNEVFLGNSNWHLRNFSVKFNIKTLN